MITGVRADESVRRTQRPDALDDWPAVAVLFSLTVALAGRLYFLIDRHAVDLLFSDQWDLYPLFAEDLSLTQLFLWQHGPPRLGVGLILTRLIADWSGWNTRAESFAVAATLILSAVGTLLLKRRLMGSLRLTDVVIPLSFLSLLHIESLLFVPMLGHSAVALVLLTLFAFVLTWQSRKRYVPLLLLNFLLVFTGFGVFVGFVTLGVLLLELRWSLHMQDRSGVRLAVASLLVAAATLVFFFVEYTPDPAVGCFRVTPSALGTYPIYMSLMLSSLMSVRFSATPGSTLVLGALLLASLVSAFAYSVWCSWRDTENRLAVVSASLIGYTLLFTLATAAGRSCLGFESAQSSRYLILQLPGIVGLYLALGAAPLQAWIKNALLCTLCAGIILAAEPWIAVNHPGAAAHAERKRAWLRCYFGTYHVKRCEEDTGLQLHPDPERVESVLMLLRERRLSVFRSPAGSAAPQFP
jgi:hypothetical protein